MIYMLFWRAIIGKDLFAKLGKRRFCELSKRKNRLSIYVLRA